MLRVLSLLFKVFIILLIPISDLFPQACYFTSSTDFDKDNDPNAYDCDPGFDIDDPDITIYINSGVTVTIRTQSNPKSINWFADVIVEGTLVLENQLILGDNSTACNYTLRIENGGSLQSGNGNDVNEQLIICDQTVLSNGNGGSNPLFTWDEIGDPIIGPVDIDDTGGTLPVELLTFTANPNENSIILRWSTASELNNDYFTLEKSHNGRDFQVMGKVEGNGTKHTQTDYSYTDKNPFLGLSYYRLSQTDFDGTSEVFPAISILFTPTSNLRVYPNPIRNNALKIQSTGYQENEAVNLNLYNVYGQMIISKKLNADSYGNLETNIQFADHWEGGNYILELTSSKGKDHFKVHRE